MDSYEHFINLKIQTGEYKDKGSKFLAFVFKVTNEEDIREQLDKLRSSYYDARHHCYAYILGENGSQYRANDDGEPSHSAGDPILGQLRSLNVTNVLCVVVRYFGGTKLGVSGLINAYKTAALLSLENAVIVEEEVLSFVRIRYPYNSTNEVMRLVDEFSLNITDQDFKMDCLLTASCNINRLDSLIEKVELLKSTGTEIELEIREENPS